MTCTDGIFIDGRRIDRGDCSGPQSAAAVLMNPAVDAAVLETARGGIIREGLAFDRCDVAVVTNIGDGDHLGLGEVNTPAELAKVKRCIVDVVPPNGAAVLNADDPLVVAMEPHCAGGIFYSPWTATIRSSSGTARPAARSFSSATNQVVVAEGDREEVVLSLDRVPLALGGKIAFQVENTLAAVAAALVAQGAAGGDPAPGWSRSPPTWKRSPAASICWKSTGRR